MLSLIILVIPDVSLSTKKVDIKRDFFFINRNKCNPISTIFIYCVKVLQFLQLLRITYTTVTYSCDKCSVLLVYLIPDVLEWKMKMWLQTDYPFKFFSHLIHSIIQKRFHHGHFSLQQSKLNRLCFQLSGIVFTHNVQQLTPVLD